MTQLQADTIDNMLVWNMLSTVPDEALMPIEGTNLDTIRSEYIKKRITEILGPIGIFWGRDIISGKLENGEYTVISRMWIRPYRVYPQLFTADEISHFDEFGHAKPKGDEINKGDLAKRAATDALSRHARLLGLAWDNFNVKRKSQGTPDAPPEQNQSGAAQGKPSSQEQPTPPQGKNQIDPAVGKPSTQEQPALSAPSAKNPGFGKDPMDRFLPYQMNADRITKWLPAVREIVKSIPPFSGMVGYWRVLDDERYLEIAFTKYTPAQQKVFASVGFTIRKTETSQALFNRYPLYTEQSESELSEAA